MGRRKGSIYELPRAGNGLTVQELELMGNLLVAFPDVIPGNRLYHLSTGQWAPRGSAANGVSVLRRRLGRGAIETVEGKGYRLGRIG